MDLDNFHIIRKHTVKGFIYANNSNYFALTESVTRQTFEPSCHQLCELRRYLVTISASQHYAQLGPGVGIVAHHGMGNCKVECATCSYCSSPSKLRKLSYDYDWLVSPEKKVGPKNDMEYIVWFHSCCGINRFVTFIVTIKKQLCLCCPRM